MTQFTTRAAGILAGLAGADEQALQKAPGARKPFVAIGMTLLVTAGAAALSMWFALYDAIDVPAPAAVPVALAWGFVIFTLDRMLIAVGMGTSTTATIGTTLVRLLAAMLIGFIVSTPLTLRAFGDDVRFQLGEMRLENAKTIQRKIDVHRESTVDVIQKEIDEQHNILAGGLPPRVDTADSADVTAATKAVEALDPELEAAKHTAEQAALLVNCEGYGVGRDQLDEADKCATPPGFNGNYPRYVRESEAAAARLDKVQSKMDTAQARLAATRKAQGKDQDAILTDLQEQAPAELERLEAQMTAAQAVLTDLQSQLDDVNAGNDGLLAQLEALERTGEEKPMLRWAHLLLALLFITLEMAPVLGKTLFTFSKRYGAYEQAFALQEAAELNAAHLDLTNQSQLAELESSLGLAHKESELKLELAREESRLQVELAREATRARLAIERGDRLEQEYADRIEAVMRERGQRELDAWQANLP